MVMSSRHSNIAPDFVPKGTLYLSRAIMAPVENATLK